MTTGQLVFYSGFAFLGLTIITTIVFLIKKPKYVPENAVYESAGTGAARRSQNGYPAEQEAARRDGAPDTTELVDTKEAETEMVSEESQSLTENITSMK